MPLDLPLIPTCRTVPDVTTSVLMNNCFATPASELTPHLGGMASLLSQLEKNAEEYEPVMSFFCLSVIYLLLWPTGSFYSCGIRSDSIEVLNVNLQRG